VGGIGPTGPAGADGATGPAGSKGIFFFSFVFELGRVCGFGFFFIFYF